MADDFDPATVTWVLNGTELNWLCAAIERCDEVVPDLETTGLFEYAVEGGPVNGGVGGRIALGSLTLPTEGQEVPTTWVVPLSHPESPWLGRWKAVMRKIARCILDAGKPLSNQNVKFDCRWIYYHTGIDLSHLIVWDTQISSHLLDETHSTKLKERAPDTFHVERWDDFDLTIPGAAERVPLLDLGMYAARDTYWTWRLMERHREEMFLDGSGEQPYTADEVEAARLGRLASWCAMPSVATLTAVEQRGITLDVDWVNREWLVHRHLGQRIGKSLAQRYPGFEEGMSFAATSGWFVEWTKAAVEAGDLKVVALTGTGKPQWTKGILVRQARNGSEVAQGILDVRSHGKKCEYLRSWLGYVDAHGVIHATYHAGSVVTGRLSSSAPNMQQVTSSLKPAFIPRPGFLFVDFDFGQIEMRVAAFIARCAPMIRAFREGADLHRILAGQMARKSPADVTPGERQGAKAGNFGFLFGMHAGGFRDYAETNYGVTFTMTEAQDIYTAFFETWDGLAQWHAKMQHLAQRDGQVVSPLGRVRRVPEVWSDDEYRSSGAMRQAINSPVQGMASDLMQIAAASIEGMLPGVPPVRGAQIVGTVHDSILVEVPEDDWKDVARECRDRMVNVHEVLPKMGCTFDVPLAVDVKVGTRWGLADVAEGL